MSGAGWRWPAVGAGGSSSGGGLAKTPAYQPNLYGATAMWALGLDGSTPQGMSGADRSGNNYNLAGTNLSPQPSNIPGKVRYCPPIRRGGMTGIGVPGAPPSNLGAMTLTMVVNFCGFETNTTQWLFAMADFGSPASGAGNCSFSVVTTGGTLRYFVQNGVGSTSSDAITSIPIPTDGLDHFLSVSRAANGVDIEFGLDGVYDTKTAPLPPSLGATGQPFVGCRALVYDLAQEIFIGGEQDICLWPMQLSRAQVQPLRAAAMGL